ncbi:integrase core domain-containing protein, partial [Brachybacterium muris]|uniref:integrase core domain-containing protein n=1 Tax=Brachybacterium muris TaxID=219301 RepID=UPI0012373872
NPTARNGHCDDLSYPNARISSSTPATTPTVPAHQPDETSRFITDVFSRRIVGWAVAPTLHTQSLPLLALEHALLSTGASRNDSGLVHHSDRGSQYVSLAYSDALIAAGVKASVGTVGDSYDNALAETVNGLYKTELIYSKRIWESVSEVELATMGWVHWWNTTRLHEALDYRTPAAVEAAYTHTTTTAPATV